MVACAAFLVSHVFCLIRFCVVVLQGVVGGQEFFGPSWSVARVPSRPKAAQDQVALMLSAGFNARH
jgi:hypothetical protein